MKFAYQSPQSRPPKWVEIKANCRDDLFKYVERAVWVYDTDSSGDDSCYFAGIFDGKIHYYQYKQEWWWENWASEDRHVANSFEFIEVTADEAKIPSPRDWLDLSPTSYPEIKRWPPNVSS